MTSSRRNRVACISAALGMVAACGGAPPATGTASGLTGTNSGEPPDGTRGMDVQFAPWASTETPSAGVLVTGSDAPFVLEIRLGVRRIPHGQPVTLDDVRSGDIVLDGDRLQVSVRTSRDAYLYLAFCSQHAGDPRYPGLSVFPDQGGIRVIANQPTLAPARGGKIGEIVLDDQPGQEALYVILSRNELSRADAGLADVLAAARRGRETTDCGARFESAVTGSRKGNTGHRGWNGGSRKSRAAQPVPHSGAESAPSPDPGRPVVQIQRGGYVEFGGVQSGVEADPDGIVILRYELKHLSASE
jgi:hypothetical protein